jgi:branched-chain amino acid transport system permease protein
LLFAFFRYTTLGLAMRAAAQNPVSSRLCGIRVSWMLALGWGLPPFGAVAGMMVAPVVFLDSEHDGRHPDLRLRGGHGGRFTSPWARWWGFLVG